MQAEIITIGDELLIGQVIDTNSAWLGSILCKNNIKVLRINTIADQVNEIENTLDTCLKRSELIIITGGLGPTNDDLTKNTLAKFFNTAWRTDEKVLDQLEMLFRGRGRELLESNKMQAVVPDICITLYNEWGTAPGMWFEIQGKIIISLPGVPHEMKNIFEQKALPEILKVFKQKKIYHKVLLTFNVPESILAQRIADIENELPDYIKLAYLPSLNLVRLRLTGTESEGQNIEAEVNVFANKISERLNEAIVTNKDRTMAEAVTDLLIQSEKTLSLAESCTGGFISHQLTMIPGVSRIFVGSVISYSNSVKHHQLGVESTLFETVGAVSEQVVMQMARGVREKLKTDYSIAVSGIAGPEGGSIDKPVGTVVIAVSSDKETISKQFHFQGDRMGIIGRTSNMAFDMLRKILD